MTISGCYRVRAVWIFVQRNQFYAQRGRYGEKLTAMHPEEYQGINRQEQDQAA